MLNKNKQDKHSGLNTQKHLDPFPNSIKVRVKIFLDIETQELREWEKEKKTTPHFGNWETEFHLYYPNIRKRQKKDTISWLKCKGKERILFQDWGSKTVNPKAWDLGWICA